MEKRTLSGMTSEELGGVVQELGLPRYAARQMASWIYQKQIFSIEEMTNLSKSSRELLSNRFTLGRNKPVDRVESKDDTVKYLFSVGENKYVETVYIPSEERATLCISSQVGCKMGCKFCMTGRQGFQGQLSVAEMLNQIYGIPEFDKLTNIVLMGQGEPMDNIDSVIRLTELLTASYGLGWSPKRITVSTVGLLPGLKRLLNFSQCNVAISLHFPFPELRGEWMPAEKAFPIENVVALLKNYDFCKDLKFGEVRDGSHQRRLSFEYIMFKDVNASEKHAQGLVNLLKGLDCRVNLIPFHQIPSSPLKGCSQDEMVRFRDYLTRHGAFSTIRTSRGQDIEAACGLLTTKKMNNK